MNKDLLINLIRLSRVGANALGATQTPQSMLDIWSVIAQAEKHLQETQADKPLPSEQ